jgi:hypothetical protein
MHKAEQEGPANKGLQSGEPIEAANTDYVPQSVTLEHCKPKDQCFH